MLTGAILAGGKSLRFGRNKALEVFHGERLIDRAVASLRPYCDPVLVVVNDLSLYEDVRATLVQDVLPHQGPLGGLYTALLFSPQEWIFAKATDMPLLVPELVQLMVERKEGFDAVVPVSDNGHFEPLLALYHRRCVPPIAALLESTDRKIISMFNKIRVRQLRESEWRSVDPQGLSFRNLNTVEDLEKLPWN